MSELAHRDPLTAWNHLCAHGGIELGGRDEGLDVRIHKLLDPGAPSLQRALENASMHAFGRAFFESIHPYVAMFSDILSFFEHADATEGQEQWTLQLDDVPLSLEHFRRWLTRWRQAARVTLDVPAVDRSGVWRLWAVLRDRAVVEEEVRKASAHRALDLPSDVRLWADAYDRGEYLPLPESLMPGRCPAELHACALIAYTALQRLMDARMTRERLMELYPRRPREIDPQDALDFWNITQNETDFWLRTFVVALSAAATHLSPAELTVLGGNLDAVTGAFPVRPVFADVSLPDVESILSLPIWSKRYELYSVWIATEVVRALEGHDVQIHHDNGRIAFPFRETLVATIHSSPGPFTLVSERRTTLEDPQGEGRSGGVQPDHGLWTVVDGDEVCRMAVEVKHYKRSAKRKFVDLFEDYARALPKAEVYLVNHGPNGTALDDVSPGVRNRCHGIEYLTSDRRGAREEFAMAVRACVGEPIPARPAAGTGTDGKTVLALDVSWSMRRLIGTPEMEAFVRRLASSCRADTLVAVDSAVRGSWAVTEAGFSQLRRQSGMSTDLHQAIRALCTEADRVVVVTDDDGISTLGEMATSVHPEEGFAPLGVKVRICGFSS